MYQTGFYETPMTYGNSNPAYYGAPAPFQQVPPMQFNYGSNPSFYGNNAGGGYMAPPMNLMPPPQINVMPPPQQIVFQQAPLPHSQSLANLRVVPQPVFKNYGPGNQNLRTDGPDEEKNARAAQITISFGQLGSYTYNHPKLISAPQEQLTPTVQHLATKETTHIYKLSKDECKQALLKSVSSQKCSTTKPIEEGHMTDVISYNALEYILETFNEKRSLMCTFTTCRPDETINALGSGQIPDAWSLACQPSNNYTDDVKRIPLPFTDCLQPCHGCNGFGQFKCSGCSGGGFQTCTACYGIATLDNVNCPRCSGVGTIPCTRCSGDGRTICNVCQGVQCLKWYLEVMVEYVNHIDKYIKEKTELPDELIETVSGEVLGENEGKQVPPMSDSDSKDIVDNSTRLIQKANQAYAHEKRVLQRHKLVCVTCAECSLEHGGQSIKFWVYGKERKVYCPEYPGGCCCTII